MTQEALKETLITRAIIDTYHRQLTGCLEVDVAVAGGGPSGLVAACELARHGRTVALFERTLSVGGGMWGGGAGYNVIVVQEQGREILERYGVRCAEYADGCFTASSVGTVAALIVAALDAGARIFNLMSVEDVMVRQGRVTGVVLNWTPIEMAGLHVDPVCVGAKYVVEATGHPLEVLKKVVAKTEIQLATPSGGIEGERSMNAELGERAVPECTVEIAPGMFVAGMAANAAFGRHRMGPIFGGMLASGQKAAEEIHRLLG